MICGEWVIEGLRVAKGGVDLANNLEFVVDQDELMSPVFSINRQAEVSMTLNLTQRQVENMWIVYSNLRRELARCPSKRVYHNAFKHHKARVREKNRKRAARMIGRMMNH